MSLLRRAALEAPGLPGASDPVAPVDAWLREAGASPDVSRPVVSDAEREALVARLRVDAALRIALAEIGARRLRLRSEPRGRFVALWDPARSTTSGLAPSDAAALSDLLERTCQELGVAAPSGVPYFLDPSASAARVRGPQDLRWGITTPVPRDRVSVLRLALMEAGDAPFVVDTLAALRACEDRSCRRSLLDAARKVVIASGYVPIEDGLGAATFAGDADPAFASALLAVDHVDRLHPARTFADLLRTVEPGASPTERRRVFFQATGEPAARLDRLVQSELAEWSRHADR